MRMLVAYQLHGSRRVHSQACRGSSWVPFSHAGRSAGGRKCPCPPREPHGTPAECRMAESHKAACADLWWRPHPGYARTWACTWSVLLARLRPSPSVRLHDQPAHERLVRPSHPSQSSRAAPSMGWRQRRARRHTAPDPGAHLPEHEGHARRRMVGFAAGYWLPSPTISALLWL